MVNIGRNEVHVQSVSTTVTTTKRILYALGSADTKVHNVYVTDLYITGSAVSKGKIGIFPETANGGKRPIRSLMGVGVEGAQHCVNFQMPYHFPIQGSTGEQRYFAASCDVARAQTLSINFYVEK
jgi:hypothetical protein